MFSYDGPACDVEMPPARNHIAVPHNGTLEKKWGTEREHFSYTDPGRAGSGLARLQPVERVWPERGGETARGGGREAGSG
jgi:hypothetical protein